MSRDCRNDQQEDGEKFQLSMGCLKFLQACSMWTSESKDGRGGLTAFLRTHTTMRSIKNILLNEDKFSRHYRLHQQDVMDRQKLEYDHVPIEKTWTGRNVDYLLQVLVGEKTLSPAGVVAPRILRRIADVLMGIE